MKFKISGADIFFIIIFIIVLLGLYARAAEMGSGSGSDYPATLDRDSTIETINDYAREDVPNDSNAAIVAVQVELGSNPAGSFNDVVERLDALGVSSSVISATYLTNSSATANYVQYTLFYASMMAIEANYATTLSSFNTVDANFNQMLTSFTAVMDIVMSSFNTVDINFNQMLTSFTTITNVVMSSMNLVDIAFDNVQSSFNLVDIAFDNVQSSFNLTDIAFDNVQSSFNAVDTNFINMMSSFNAIDTNFDQMLSSFTTITDVVMSSFNKVNDMTDVLGVIEGGDGGSAGDVWTKFASSGSWAEATGIGGGYPANELISFFIPGDAYVTDGIAYYGPIQYQITIASAMATITGDGTTAEGGEGIGFDIMTQSVTTDPTPAFTSILNSTYTFRLTVTSTWTSTTDFGDTSLDAGDVLRLDIKGIGTTRAGGDPILVTIFGTQE